MIIYHGSEYVIEYPQPWLGRKNNDYGQGFYCTESEKMASEWATINNSNGFVNKYRFDDLGLKVLDLLNGQYHVLNWLAILLENRTFRIDNDVARQARSYILHNFSVDYAETDVIIGYRADDSYFSFASSFLNNTLPLSGLEKAIRLGNLGEQVFIKSREAFDRLEFMEAKPVYADVYYPLYLQRDRKARADYGKLKYSAEKDIFIIDIIRENRGNEDERLQRIVRV